MAFQLDISVFKHTQWGGAIGNADLITLGKDWSAATFKLEVRTAKAAAGAALITLNNATAGSEGVSATYDPDYVDPENGEVAGATIIRPQIDEATLSGLAAASPASADRVLYYDLHVTPSGLPKRVYCYGAFTVDPGVTV